MRQTKKETLIKKIEKFSKLVNFSSNDIDEIFDFRKELSEDLKKQIELRQFSGSDLEIFWKFYTRVHSIWKLYEEWNKLKEILDDICKSYITLLIQFNKPFDKYLKEFDEDSSFYKKMTALSIIRNYRGSIENFKYEFKNISQLLYEAIEKDPKSYDQCCNIAYEYLNIALPKHDFGDFEKNHNDEPTNIERINFLYKYWYPKFIELLRNNKFFDNWLNEMVWIDSRLFSKKWFQNIVDEIFSLRKINVQDRRKIEDKFSESFSKINSYYDEKENYLQEEWNYVCNNYSEYIEKFKKQNKDKTELSSNIDEDLDIINKEIAELEKKYYWEWCWVVEVSSYDLKNIDKFIEYQRKNERMNGFWANKTILGVSYYDKKYITDEMINKTLEDLKKYDEITIAPWEDFEFTKHIDFEIHRLPEDLCILYSIYRWLQLLQSSLEFNSFIDTKKLERIDISKELIIFIRELNEVVCDFPLSKELTENNDVKNNEPKNINSVESSNSNREPNEDKKAIKELDKTIDDLKKTIDEYYSKINDLERKNKLLNNILRENWLSDNNWKEEDLIEKRKQYKITVIWWSPESIKWFNNLKKNKEFLDRLENHYHLEFKQFDLTWDYKKQQDKKFAGTIEDKLIFDKADFIIVLQSDHETALKNLIDSREYSSRITCFWELDQNGNISKINQHFSYTKFDKYLGIALNKFETKINNDLTALS